MRRMPRPAGVIRDDHPAGAPQRFDVALVPTEAAVQPARLADDFGGPAVVLVVVGRWWAQAVSLAHTAAAEHATQQVEGLLGNFSGYRGRSLTRWATGASLDHPLGSYRSAIQEGR
jgi:hypothetical protein